MKYLIFSFLRFGDEVKRDVEFRYLTLCLFQNSTESGKQNILTLVSLCLPCYLRMQQEAGKKYISRWLTPALVYIINIYIINNLEMVAVWVSHLTSFLPDNSLFFLYF